MTNFWDLDTFEEHPPHMSVTVSAQTSVSMLLVGIFLIIKLAIWTVSMRFSANHLLSNCKVINMILHYIKYTLKKMQDIMQQGTENCKI